MSAENPQSSEFRHTPEPVPLVQSEADDWNEVRAEKLYMEHLKQAWEDIQSMSDQFDKNILTFSSAGLGLSIAFLKDIVPVANATALWLLFGSWAAFGMAIMITIASFQVSIKAQKIHVEHLRKYYMERKREYSNATNHASSWLRGLTVASGAFFVLAVAGIITFAVENVREVKDMSFPLKVQGGRLPMGVTTIGPNQEIKGRLPVSMTPVVPTSQVTPASPAPAVAPAPAAPATPSASSAQSNTK